MNQQERSRQEYIARVNKVMDYIEHHLDEPINLNKLAEIAHFSPFHFHRIFSFLTQETPSNFIQRLRIEKAASLLLKQQNIPITDIAYQCGFSSLALFSRTFRKYFGLTAKEFRAIDKIVFVKDGLRYSKNGQLISKNGQVVPDLKSELCNVKLNQLNIKNIIFMNTKIEIKDLPETKIIYYRHTGAFDQIGQAFEKVCRWAGPRGLLAKNPNSVTVYHDDPSVTAIEKVRQSAGIIVEHDIPVDGEIGKMTIPGGKYAVGQFEINVDGFEKAWNSMCNWLMESGYEPGESNPYELYHNDRKSNYQFVVDICIPIKSL